MTFYRIVLNKVGEGQWNVRYSEAEHLIQQNDVSGFTVYSRVFEGEEVNELITGFNFNFNKSFYLLGISNTLLIEEIYKRMTVYSSLTVFEITDSEELILYGSEAFLKLILSNKIEFIVGTYNEIISKIPRMVSAILKIYNIRNTEIITTPEFKSRHPKLSRSLVKNLLEYLQYQLSGMGNSVEDILWGTDNLINNWGYQLKGLYSTHIKDIYKDKPAVIVGAGPSLDKNIHLLKDIKDKALIFAVDATVDTLDNIGLVADAYTTIERTDETLRFYTRHNISKNAVFVGSNIIVGDVLKEFEKWIFTGRNGDGFFRTFNNHIGNENLDIGLNVANVLFSFARSMGCNPIILVGLDLAYTDGKTHTQNIVENMEADIKAYYDDLVTTVVGQNGEVLKTYEYFQYAKLWFEKRLANDSEIICYNATEGGANIIGAQNVKLADMVDMLKHSPHIEKRLYQYYDELYYLKRNSVEMTNEAIEFITATKETVEELIETATEARRNIVESEKFGRVGRVEDNRMNIDIKLMKRDETRFLFQPVYVNYNRKLHSMPVFLETEDEEKLIEISLNYYSDLMNVGKTINDTLLIYLEILNNHLGILQEGNNVES